MHFSFHNQPLHHARIKVQYPVMVVTATFWFYEELNDFLAPERRKRAFRRWRPRCRVRQIRSAGRYTAAASARASAAHDTLRCRCTPGWTRPPAAHGGLRYPLRQQFPRQQNCRHFRARRPHCINARPRTAVLLLLDALSVQAALQHGCRFGQFPHLQIGGDALDRVRQLARCAEIPLRAKLA